MVAFLSRSRPVVAGLMPGIALAAAVAGAAVLAEPLARQATGGLLHLPAIVIALVFGVVLHSFAARPVFDKGLTWCVKKLLRIAIGLLGVRIALSDIAGLGVPVALLVVAAMAVTVASGLVLARFFGLSAGFGALAGAANAVCGASATLATATVVPNYPQKSADVAFTVIAANAVSTVVMLAYPPLAVALGSSVADTGILIGAAIHDMAQVAGAGYAVSEPAGNVAVIVKLFRVLLLLPVVLAIGWWFASRGDEAGAAKVPIPLFALAFIGLVLVNSFAPHIPGFAPLYAFVRPWLVQASSLGLLLAIAALGLQTSVTALMAIGWRHAVVFLALTVLILGLVVAGLAVIG